MMAAQQGQRPGCPAKPEKEVPEPHKEVEPHVEDESKHDNSQEIKPEEEEKEPLPLPAAQFKTETIPHGTIVEPNTTMIKTWTVYNNGLVAWPADTKLVFLRGDRELLGSAMEQFPVSGAKPLEEIELTAVLEAPSKPGRFMAMFQLWDPNGAVFGPRLVADIIVSQETEIKVPEPEIKVPEPESEPVVEEVKPEVKKPEPVVEEVKPEVKPEDVKPEVAVHVPLAVPVPIPVAAVAAPYIPSPYIPSAHWSGMEQLKAMGFPDELRNSQLLAQFNGDVQSAVLQLLGA